MRRRTVLAAAGALGATLSTAGCLSQVQSAVDPSDSDAQTEADAQSQTVNRQATVTETAASGQLINVGAQGRVEAEPNTATVSVGLEETGSDAETVRSALAERAEELKETLLAYGLDDEQITTGRFDIREQRQSAGYRGFNEFQIETDDPDAVGEIIDTAVAGGADDVGRIIFGLSEDRRNELREEAIEVALDDARYEAEIIANAKNLTLTGVESVTTDPGRVSTHRATPDVAVEETDDAGGPPTQIDQGLVSVSASVDVSYRFEE